MFSQYVIGTFGEELGGEPGPDPAGVGERSGGGQSDGEAAVRGIGFVGISMLVVTWRMTQAYKRYMGFDHALATIVAAQVITMLLVLNWIGFWANFG